MKTLKIGKQEWATEDLKVTKFRNGEDIPLVTDDDEWTQLTTAAYCISPKGHYLYNWYAVNDSRGLAPEGFHVPTDAEWTELTNTLGGDEVAGKTMKTEEWGGSNQSGFSALPGGYRYDVNGDFYNLGYSGSWWSSSADGANGAWYRYLFFGNGYVNRNNYYLRIGFSVRCLKTFNTNEK